MGLCFAWWLVCFVFTVNIWGYDDWAAMSYKMTRSEGAGIASGFAIIEGILDEGKERFIICLPNTRQVYGLITFSIINDLHEIL
jgi:hypothetical protein